LWHAWLFAGGPVLLEFVGKCFIQFLRFLLIFVFRFHFCSNTFTISSYNMNNNTINNTLKLHSIYKRTEFPKLCIASTNSSCLAT
jgi:hypothetical protein